MRARWILLGALSASAGFGFGLLMPQSWQFLAPYGFLLGAGIFVLGFRGRSPVRAILFLALTALFLYLRYGAREHMDLTWPLAAIASWSLVEFPARLPSRGRTRDGRGTDGGATAMFGSP